MQAYSRFNGGFTADMLGKFKENRFREDLKRTIVTAFTTHCYCMEHFESVQCLWKPTGGGREWGKNNPGPHNVAITLVGSWELWHREVACLCVKAFGLCIIRSCSLRINNQKAGLLKGGKKRCFLSGFRCCWQCAVQTRCKLDANMLEFIQN